MGRALAGVLLVFLGCVPAPVAEPDAIGWAVLLEEGSGWPDAVAASPDGASVAVAVSMGDRSRVVVLDARGAVRWTTEERAWISELAVDPQTGEVLGAGGVRQPDPQQERIRWAASGEVLERSTEARWIQQLAFTTDGDACWSDYDLGTGQRQLVIQPFGGEPSLLATPDWRQERLMPHPLGGFSLQGYIAEGDGFVPRLVRLDAAGRVLQRVRLDSALRGSWTALPSDDGTVFVRAGGPDHLTPELSAFTSRGLEGRLALGHPVAATLAAALPGGRAAIFVRPEGGSGPYGTLLVADATAAVLWSRGFGGPGDGSGAMWLRAAPFAGGIVAAGSLCGPVNLGPVRAPPGCRAFVARLDAAALPRGSSGEGSIPSD